MSDSNLNGVRRSALDEIDKSRRTAKLFLAAAATFEGALLIAVLVLIDFSDRTHLVVFLCACLVYGTLAFGLFALRAHIDAATLRTLHAIGLLAEREM